MRKISIAVLSTLIVLSINALFVTRTGAYESVGAYTNNDAATYYNDVEELSTSSALTNSLNSLNNEKRDNLISYNSLSNYFTQTDPGVTSGQVTAFYSGVSAYYSRNMNKEHVWPFSKLYINTGSRGQNDIEKDLHMIRPALKDDNEGRGNSFFTYPTGQGWDPGSLGDETYRGDSARIIFYCTIADLNLTLVDRDYDSKDNHTMGRLSTLLEWNILYPVSQREKTRNEAVERIQGHRNPFIDHPEYACRIWGNTNSATRSACAAQGFSGTLQIEKNNEVVNKVNMIVDNSFVFKAEVNNSSTASYSWKLVDQSGAAIESSIVELTPNGNQVTVTAKEVGEVYLEATFTDTLSNGTTETLKRKIKINIEDKTRLEALTLDYWPIKQVYYVGETFDSTGIKATAKFNNIVDRDVTNEITYSDTAIDNPGTKYITVSYTYDGVTKSATFDIIIKEKKSTPTSSGGGGCAGDISSTSILLASLASVGILLTTISIRRKKKEK